MPYVITRSCCNDASCVPVCPVNCIHPTPDEPGYGTTEMLHIDPEACIECGACLDVCPVSAIFPADEMPERLMPFLTLNSQYYAEPAHADYSREQSNPPRHVWRGGERRGPRVAIVGSGPSACYAAKDLLTTRKLLIEVDMFERLPAPFGLVRYGVAPDHQDTKTIAASFQTLLRNRRFRLLLNTTVGVDVSHDDLADNYDAVLYAVGAARDRRLNIDGEDLLGSHAATEFVNWINGHPDAAEFSCDLATERAVVVGNGNVALDVARVLAQDPVALAKTDIADHALAALRASHIREVVVLGRRGPVESAFTVPELFGLLAADGVDVVVESAELDGAEARTPVEQTKLDILRDVSMRPRSGGRVVRLRFLASPLAILGSDRVTGVRLGVNELTRFGGRMTARPTGAVDVLKSGFVLRSAGNRGAAVEGLPFDPLVGIIPNERGRVRGMNGVYVTGWIKRGPTGVIGTNKPCAAETVTSLLNDLGDRRLTERPDGVDLATRLPHAVPADGWRAIDDHERARGAKTGRPRVKLVTTSDLLAVANGQAPAADRRGD